MLNKVKEAINAYNMIKTGDTVIVGLSGGADSVSLLFAMRKLSSELSFSVRACHINHNLRGEESDADEKYVRELCASIEIPLDVFSVDVNSALEKHQSVEECARKLRYEAFSSLAEKYSAKIATAHSAGDNAETIFLNIIRGTGLKGLCGIPPVREYLIRPLIFCSRAEIEAFCAEKNLKFVTDKTNFSTEYSRNKVRLEVIPRLLEMNPSLFSGMSRMTQNLIEDSAYLENLALIAKNNAFSDGKYTCEKINLLDKPIKTRVISQILWENEIEPTALKINGILEIIALGNGKINLEKNKFAIVKKGFFTISTIFQNYRQKLI